MRNRAAAYLNLKDKPEPTSAKRCWLPGARAPRPQGLRPTSSSKPRRTSLAYDSAGRKSRLAVGSAASSAGEPPIVNVSDVYLPSSPEPHGARSPAVSRQLPTAFGIASSHSNGLSARYRPTRHILAGPCGGIIMSARPIETVKVSRRQACKPALADRQCVGAPRYIAYKEECRRLA